MPRSLPGDRWQGCGPDRAFTSVKLRLRYCRVARRGRAAAGRRFARARKEGVMRTVLVFVALTAGMSACAAISAAEDEKGDQKAGGGLAERIQDLNLTEEQETKIADIRKECKPKVQEAAKELATIV